MKKRLIVLLAALALILPLGAGVAMAGRPTPDNPNNTGPDGKPCNADHDHPDDGLAKNKKCQGTEGPPGDETCEDGVDNDGDGKTDAEDEDCQEPEGPPGDPTCEDGIDNDGDGLTDDDDPDCQTPTENCTNGVDDDGDGLTDGDDPDCQTPTENCTNGVDDDGDGLTDGDDPDCQTPTENCTNGVDDDGDGLTDGDDPDCQTPTENCTNGVDDDGDGLTDGDDPDCQTGGDLTCRARVVSADAGNDGADLSVIESNEAKDPCAGDADGLAPATLPLPARILSTETNADGSASSRVLDLGGGEGDPGRVSILGADADCDGNSDAWVLLIQDGEGNDVLRLDSAEGGILPNLSPDGSSGIFWTSEEDGHAQAILITGEPGSLRVVEAEACDA